MIMMIMELRDFTSCPFTYSNWLDKTGVVFEIVANFNTCDNILHTVFIVQAKTLNMRGHF